MNLREEDSENYVVRMEALRRAVLGAGGSTSQALRTAISEYAAKRMSFADAPPLDRNLSAFVDDLVHRPTSCDVEGLLARMTEDEVFEVVCAAAVGVGLSRATNALALLSGIPS